MIELHRFLFLTALLLAGIAVQTRLVEAFNVTIDIVFVCLIVFAFWDLLAEHLILTVLAVFLMNWRPGFAPELIFLGVFPIVLFLVRGYFPWRRGITMLLGITIGITGMYLIIATNPVFSKESFFWKDMGGSLVFGLALFWFLRMMYHPKVRGFGKIYGLPR